MCLCLHHPSNRLHSIYQEQDTVTFFIVPRARRPKPRPETCRGGTSPAPRNSLHGFQAHRTIGRSNRTRSPRRKSVDYNEEYNKDSTSVSQIVPWRTRTHVYEGTYHLGVGFNIAAINGDGRPVDSSITHGTGAADFVTDRSTALFIHRSICESPSGQDDTFDSATR